MTLDEQTASLAVLSAKMARESGDPQKFICEAGWCALALLHDLMVKRKEITPLMEIGSDKKLKYWTMSCLARPEASKAKRIWISQGLYMYDLINNHEAHH